ncbi:hypothetical protein QJS10_CPB12g01648 [Acorus calamus]|uniref:Uncharacterized protein n=1 Tax=Acorus calamus TaxID=4465 RepID=A0AAV9DLH0_ACOCL|nr:hypothetical protein QJS10_CPB12g01648 [Acorus calamus]
MDLHLGTSHSPMRFDYAIDPLPFALWGHHQKGPLKAFRAWDFYVSDKVPND